MSSMTERKMRFLKDIVIFIWLSTLFAPLLAGPIEKDAAFTEKARPKTGAPVIPVAIPEEVNSLAVFGDELVYEEADPQFQNPRRDQVCESEASIGCKDRCITIDANCLCGTNGKTYRNVCEMACMRKVDMETINVRNVGKCEPREGTTQPPTEEIIEEVCSAERVMNYRKMLKELMTTKYLADHVRRCEKISNCNQAKVVVQFATKSGSQSIMECPENLPAFFLFTGLDCADYVDTTLQSVFNNETVVNCKSAGKVRNRLFNKKNCGWSNHGPTEKELVTWSFDILDENYDRQLVEKELNMLTNIPDQQCGESFFMDCDTDMDGFIREDEWSVCLGCPDCYRPCLVYQSKTMTDSKTRRYVQPIVTCEADGSCASKQCEKLWALHEVCWCVDRQCNEIEDTRSYAAMDCSARR
ncbi:uncharacterized protein LOC134814600 isoform X3 [Bolinopsis microptera]|uniref:uncharacterized protein LOC134814600 isoform X3 n=1 Tax=Bolinopsis microptera TaxID=2820187 RepID=UPI003078EEA4